MIQFCFLAFFSFALLSCADQSLSATSSNNSNATPKKTPTEFERELKSLKNADFDYIFAFKRKDGEAFESEDKKAIRQHSYVANRRTLTGDEKIVFVGSNYKILEKDMKKLKERFEVEDFSKTEEQIEKEKKKKKEESEGNTNQQNSNVNK